MEFSSDFFKTNGEVASSAQLYFVSIMSADTSIIPFSLKVNENFQDDPEVVWTAYESLADISTASQLMQVVEGLSLNAQEEIAHAFMTKIPRDDVETLFSAFSVQAIVNLALKERLNLERNSELYVEHLARLVKSDYEAVDEAFNTAQENDEIASLAIESAARIVTPNLDIAFKKASNDDYFELSGQTNQQGEYLYPELEKLYEGFIAQFALDHVNSDSRLFFSDAEVLPSHVAKVLEKRL